MSTKQMGTASLSNLLHLTFLLASCHGAKLPKYRAVVYPEVFDARDSDDGRVLKINEKITLNLKPSSVLHPQFFLRTYRQGVPQHRYFNVEAFEENLYADESKFAAVILSEENNALQVDGVVGPNLRIRPAEGMERSENGHQPHVLETIHDTESDHVYGKIPEERLAQISARASKLDPEAYKLKAVYPEIFVVIDSRFRGGFPSEEKMLQYLIIEFQVVNLRYRTVSNPNIQLVYRGVEVSDYRQEHKYYVYIDYGIDALKSLYKIVDFVAANPKNYQEYDLVYFLTGYDMIAVEGSKRESVLKGYAFVASACTDKRQQLGEDKPYSYEGIRIMAHEVGHSMGCSHDGTAVDGIIEKFKSDSVNCPWQDGYIMSYIEEDYRSFHFSSCCNYMMSLVSWSVGAACLRSNQTNTYVPGMTGHIDLPGEILDRNKQCRLTYPTLMKTYYMPEYGTPNCKAECFVPGWQFQAADSHWPMLLIDGSICHDKMNWICINGKCVDGYRRRRPVTTSTTRMTKSKKSKKEQEKKKKKEKKNNHTEKDMTKVLKGNQEKRKQHQ